MEVQLLRRRIGGSAELTLAQQVEAIIAGTTGFALDPSDTSKLWQDSTRTTPVTTAAQPVGAFDSKWGTINPTLIQATAAARPAWDGAAALTFDGVDDFLRRAVLTDLTNGASGLFVCQKLNTGGNGIFFRIRNDVNTLQRITLQTNGGAIATNSASTDGVAQTFTSVESGHGGVYFSAYWDFIGARAYLRRNGVAAGNAALTGAAGALPNSGNLTIDLCASVRAATIGRTVFLPFVPTAEQITTIESWVNEV